MRRIFFLTRGVLRPHHLLAALLTFVLVIHSTLAPEAVAAASGRIELVATWPAGLEGGPPLASTADVWMEMIDAATTRIDLAHFYASNEAGSRLEPVVAALEAAAARGVAVRFLTEDSFFEIYPATLDRLDTAQGVEVRRLRTRDLLEGVLHTKMMLVDGRELFVGSPNFDWRALEHIVELGVRVRDSAVVAACDDLFAADWQLAGSASGEAVTPRVHAEDFPATLRFGVHAVQVTPVFGSLTGLPDPELWDWPRLLAMVEAVQRSLELQALTYSPIDADGQYWAELDQALRAAAARGVLVRILVSHWDTREGRIEHLQSLQCVPGIEVRIATVPPAEGGFIPFARVIHSKFIVADGALSWVGTSNFQRSYFYAGRHAGLIVNGASFAGALLDLFERVWQAEWSEGVDPARSYDMPRVGE